MEWNGKMKLINIEGLDGTGKHTIALALQTLLQHNNINVGYLEFPAYDTPTGNTISEFLKGNVLGDSKLSDPYASSLLYTIDRIVYINNNIDKLRENDIIISDRSYLSNFFYQASKLVDIESAISTKDSDNYSKLYNFMDLMSMLELAQSRLLDIVRINEIRNIYLYHPNIDINIKLINGRNREKDLNEDLSYLSRVNNFAHNIYMHSINAKSICPGISYQGLFSQFPMYWYEPVQCSDKDSGELYHQSDIAETIYNDVIMRDEKEYFKHINSPNSGYPMGDQYNYSHPPLYVNTLLINRNWR